MNYQCHQYGDAKPVVTKAVPTATVIEVNDMIAQVAADGLPYPASAHVWNADLATTQAEFIVLFLGVSTEFSRSGDIAPIKVNTAGVHEFECAAAQFKIGALVGPAKQSGNLLEDRKVASVATENLAIGRVAKDYPANTTKVLVEIFSSIMKPKVA
jgi:hypothetical protein